MFKYPEVVSNQFRLVIQNISTGERYRIETSTNLQTWNSLGTITNTAGQLEFNDSFSRSQPRKFYRAVLVK